MSDLEKAAFKAGQKALIDLLPQVVAAEEARIPAPYNVVVAGLLNQSMPAIQAWLLAKVDAE